MSIIFYMRHLATLKYLAPIALTSILLTQGKPVQATIDTDLTAGITQYQKGNYQTAIEIWRSRLKSDPSSSQHQLLLQNLAQAYKQIGDLDNTIAYWQTLIDLAKTQNNRLLQGLALIEQAQAYSAIGRPRVAITLLCASAQLTQCPSDSAIAIAQQSGNLNAQAAALGSLGDAYRTLGEYDRATEILQLALTRAERSQNPDHKMAALNSLGNNARSLRQRHLRRAESLSRQGEKVLATKQTEQAQQQTTIAQNHFRQSLTLAEKTQNRSLQVQTRLNQLNLATTIDPTEFQTLQQLIAQLPKNRARIYSTIDLARYGNTVPLLTEAVSLAQHIQDTRGESFALGELGQWHEKQKNFPKAEQLTQQAIFAADRAQAKESRYQWEWQLGRILRAQNRIDEAIVVYETAIATLESIREDLLAANRNLQFDFRDSVEPIYRELIALRFQTPTPQQTPNLDAALSTLDSLRLAELQNYFGSDCLLRASEQTQTGQPAAKQDQKNAVLHSVVLDDRIIITLSLPNQPTQFATHKIDRADLEKEVIQFRRTLETYYNPFQTDRATRFYDWLIRPFAQKLNDSQIETLVFVNDGILRSIPMAALYDGKQFLIEKYAIAITPSLSLTAPQTTPQSPSLLAAGLSEETTIDGKVYEALAAVPEELASLQQLFPNSRILKNQDFTRTNLQQALQQAPAPRIHLATHGQFGAEAEDTFLITGDGQKLSLTQLDELIRNLAKTGNNELIDLLTLTACQTAVGDDRAALGLAGIAIQAGAKSAIASLWSINDNAASQFSQSFYRNLTTVGKAKALQQAQIQMLRQTDSVVSRPAYWSAYVLVGSWQ